MAYRDSFEQCPRCHLTLVDTGTFRACEQCQGQWVAEPVLAEMILRMLPLEMSPLGELYKAVLERGGEKLACPTCGEKMEIVTIHGVTLDRCPKQHGVWFDYPELQQSLQAVARYGLAGPPPPPPVAGPHVAPSASAGGPALRIVVATPGQEMHEVMTRKQIVKIGTLSSCDVRIASDPRVARMHAIIEISSHEVVLIDLGSGEGTLVNGAPIQKHALREGDRILVGSTELTLAFVEDAAT